MTPSRSHVLPRARLATAAALARVLAVVGLLLALPPAATTAARPASRPIDRDAGMSTAEYAVGTVAAVAFAAILYKVVQSGAVQSALSSIIEGALGISL